MSESDISDLPIDWFLREEIKDNIINKSRDIALLALSKNFDYAEDVNELTKCIHELVPIGDMTAEELAFAIELCTTACTYESLVKKGMLTHNGQGYLLTKKGKMYSDLIRRKENAIREKETLSQWPEKSSDL